MTARKHMNPSSNTNMMDCTITEARLLTVEREYEEAAKSAKTALHIARMINSTKGVNEVGKIYALLSQLAPKNPYVCNLGVELERRSRKCAVEPFMSQSRERDTTGTEVVKAQPYLNPKGVGGQQQG
jgi:hypothetical protein